ncbi:hypothetical protein [Acinetobacter sp.]|uniref:hypothetical protein n=1 Tax=Acinetobacter sp. TaxID=472 RepID=UPI0035B04D4C
MKKLTSLMLGAVLISGCAALPESENIGTRGLLLCEANELCPAVTVSWNEQKRDLLDVQINLNSVSNNFEIKQVSFSNGQKSFSFTPAGKTEHEVLFGMNRSRNSVAVPARLMADLDGKKPGQKITMSLETDKGAITRYVLNDGKESLLYQQFKTVYNP